MSGFANSWHTKAWPFLMNAFIYTDDYQYLNVQNGKVIASFLQPQWREGMRYVASLFKDGLMDKQMFVQDQSALAKLVEGDTPRVGAAPLGHRGMAGSWVGGLTGGSGSFRALPPIAGPAGNRTTGYFPFGPKESDSAAITKDAKNPEAVYKWIDLIYSREASVRQWFGALDVDLRWAKDGEVGIDGDPAIYTYLGKDAIFQEAKQNQAWVHSSPFFMPSRLFGGQAGDPKVFNYEGYLIQESKKYYPYIPKEFIPPMTLTADESKAITEIKTNINKYIDESAAKFVTGRLDINDNTVWNSFQAELDKMGLPKYLEVMNKAYERYK
jgi:putative aldouronate transport system substrate-binding protein